MGLFYLAIIYLSKIVFSEKQSRRLGFSYQKKNEISKHRHVTKLNSISAPTPETPDSGLELRLLASNNGELIQGKATCYYDDPKTDACGNNGLPQVTFPKGFSTALG